MNPKRQPAIDRVLTHRTNRTITDEQKAALLVYRLDLSYHEIELLAIETAEEIRQTFRTLMIARIGRYAPDEADRRWLCKLLARWECGRELLEEALEEKHE